MGNTFNTTNTENMSIKNREQRYFNTGAWGIISNPENHTLYCDRKQSLIMLWSSVWYIFKGLKLNNGKRLSLFLNDNEPLPKTLTTIQEVLDEIQEIGVDTFEIKNVDLPLSDKVSLITAYLKSLCQEELRNEVYILSTRTVKTYSGSIKPCFALGLPKEDTGKPILDLGSGGGRIVNPVNGIQGKTMEYNPAQEEKSNLGIPTKMLENIAKHFSNVDPKPIHAYGTAWWRNNPVSAEALKKELEGVGIPYTTLTKEKEAEYGTQSMVNIFVREKLKRNESPEVNEFIPQYIISGEFGKGSGQVGMFELS